MSTASEILSAIAPRFDGAANRALFLQMAESRTSSTHYGLNRSDAVALRAAHLLVVNEAANAWSVATVADIGPGDCLLCGLPLFHSNAMMVTGLAPFSVGAHVVLLSPSGYRDPRTFAAFWRSVARYRATFFSAVPTVLSALLNVPRDGADIGSLRFAICGAAPLAPELFQRFERATGLKLLEGYGATEAAPVWEGQCPTAHWWADRLVCGGDVVDPRSGESTTPSPLMLISIALESQNPMRKRPSPHSYVVIHGRTPEGFTDWSALSHVGFSVAEVFLEFRPQAEPLPEDFTRWDLPTMDQKSTIAHRAVMLGRPLPANFQAWDLLDPSGKTVITVAREAGNASVIAQYEAWVLAKGIGQPSSASDKPARPVAARIHRRGDI